MMNRLQFCLNFPFNFKMRCYTVGRRVARARRRRVNRRPARRGGDRPAHRALHADVAARGRVSRFVPDLYKYGLSLVIWPKVDVF